MSGAMALIGASGHRVVRAWSSSGSTVTRGNRSAHSRRPAFKGTRLRSAIALTGDQAVVTAPGDAGGYGAAYVFRRVAQGGRGRGAGAPLAQRPAGALPAPATGNFTWLELTRLATPAGPRTDVFGVSLAADEREVWIGAPRAGGPGRVSCSRAIRRASRSTASSFSAREVPTRRRRLLGVHPWQRRRLGAIGANRSAGGLLIYERDAFGAWREQPMLTLPLDDWLRSGSERRCTAPARSRSSTAAPPTVLVPAAVAPDVRRPLHPDERHLGLDRPADQAGVGARRSARRHDVRRHHQPDRAIVVADLPLTDGARPARGATSRSTRTTPLSSLTAPVRTACRCST